MLVNQTGKVCGMHMSQGGSFTPQQVLSSVETATQQARLMFGLMKEKIGEKDSHRNTISTFLN